MSEAEAHRGASLLMLQDRGVITKLRFQPRFPLNVNNTKICNYVADADYYNDKGEYIVEDTKPPKFMTDLSKHKIKHFQLQYCVTVTIPQRANGTL